MLYYLSNLAHDGQSHVETLAVITRDLSLVYSVSFCPLRFHIFTKVSITHMFLLGLDLGTGNV